MNFEMAYSLCSAVYAVESDAKNANHFRFPIRGKAHKPTRRVASAHTPSRVSSLTWSNLRQGFLPNQPNRVTAQHRVMSGAYAKEWRGKGSQPARLIGCASSHYDQSAGCNSGRRNKASVGDGNHCARLLKAKRPSDRRDVKSNHFPIRGWFGSLSRSQRGIKYEQSQQT